MVLITALQRKLRRKAVAKLCEWPSSRSVSDSSRYIRSRAQYAARRLVLVKVDLPKGTGGLTGHAHASQSHDGAARTGWDGGGWRVAVFRSVSPARVALSSSISAPVGEATRLTGYPVSGAPSGTSHHEQRSFLGRVRTCDGCAGYALAWLLGYHPPSAPSEAQRL